MFTVYPEDTPLEVQAVKLEELVLDDDPGDRTRIVLCKSQRGRGWPFMLVTSSAFKDVPTLKKFAGVIASMMHPTTPSGPLVLTTEGDEVSEP